MKKVDLLSRENECECPYCLLQIRTEFLVKSVDAFSKRVNI